MKDMDYLGSIEDYKTVAVYEECGCEEGGCEEYSGGCMIMERSERGGKIK